MSEALEAYKYALRYGRRAVLIFSIDSHGKLYAATYADDPLLAEVVNEMSECVMDEDAVASEQCRIIKKQLTKDD